MAHTTKYEDRAGLEALVAELDRPDFVLWTSEILVHDRSPDGEPCPCCGSRTARLAETIDDGAVIIERSTGDRLGREDVDDATWDYLCADAEVASMRPVVFRPQLRIVMSDARVTVIDGGAQSGKTEGAARRFARLLHERGGPQRTFWLVAPSRRSAWIMAQKLAIGYQGRPPVLPRSLIRRSPTTGDGSAPLTIELVDGSIIDCRPAVRADGSSVDGQECEAVWVDEVTKIRHQIYWREALNRTTATGGPVIGTSVPMPGHWFQEEIEAAKKLAGANGPSLMHAAVSRYDNYAMSREVVDEQVAVMMAKPNGKVIVDLDIWGLWVNPDHMPFWTTFDTERHVLPDVVRQIDLMTDPRTGERFVDVTAEALKLCASGPGWYTPGQRRGSDEFIIGMDVNLSPCTAIVCKVVAPAGGVRDMDAWSLVVVDEVSRQMSVLEAFCDNVLKVARRGSYRGCTVIVDGTAMHRSAEAMRKTGSSSTIGKAVALAGFDARPPAHTDPRPGKRPNAANPKPDDSHGLVHEFLRQDRLLVAGHCARLLHAFDKQQRDPVKMNQPYKVANTASDRLSNAMDGLRYVLWRVFGERSRRRDQARLAAATRPAFGYPVKSA